MAKVGAFHSSETKDVHHTCSNCTKGNNIESKNKASGTGGLPKCSECVSREEKGTC